MFQALSQFLHTFPFENENLTLTLMAFSSLKAVRHKPNFATRQAQLENRGSRIVCFCVSAILDSPSSGAPENPPYQGGIISFMVVPLEGRMKGSSA